MYHVDRFGNEGEPVVTIDDFFDRPEALISLAAQQKFETPNSLYPGIQSPAPPMYLKPAMGNLQTILEDVFGFKGKRFELVQCVFGLVTLRPDELRAEQSVPHFDTSDPNRIALLHYMVDEDVGGGTNFYRHRSTQYEKVTPDKFSNYVGNIEAEFQAGEIKEQEYISEDTSIFEKIGSVRAKMNRLVIYRSCLLHSGYIPPKASFSSNPMQGRLTINSFLQAV